jgi:hypothetical protein
LQNEIFIDKQNIYKAINENELNKIAIDRGLVLGGKSKFEKQLTAINNFALGRSML